MNSTYRNVIVNKFTYVTNFSMISSAGSLQIGLKDEILIARTSPVQANYGNW